MSDNTDPTPSARGSEDGSGDASGGAAASGPSETSNQQTGSVITYFTQRKIDGLLLATRIASIVFTFLFLIPLAGQPHSNYQKALFSNAATSALRLHQRVPHFRLNREFFSTLVAEDSCHYLFYTLIFVAGFPITLVLLPVVAFAALHSASAVCAAFRAVGQVNSPTYVKLYSLVQQYQTNTLRFIATAEIVIFPLIFITIISGQMNILMPFLYYRFLCLRYTSSRNPYSRQMFYEFRLSAQQLAGHPRCPRLFGTIIHKAIALICRVSPV